MHVCVKTTVQPGGKVTLSDLPFAPGEQVEVTVAAPTPLATTDRYPLRGRQPFRYDDPDEPAVPVEDWEVYRK